MGRALVGMAYVGMAVQVRLRPLSAADRERGDTGCVAVRPT